MEMFVEKNVFVAGSKEDALSSAILPRKYPQAIKYMGSKASLLEFIGEGLAEVGLTDRPLVDLFAGAGAISGGFGHLGKIISNDIQQYSAVIASLYLRPAQKIGSFNIVELARPIVEKALAALPDGLAYNIEKPSLQSFNQIEKRNKQLLFKEFDSSHHLFTRLYSGTWWSAEQCVWIDAIREVLDTLLREEKIEHSDFNFGLTCLLSAMAYTSQGTGHYAQYRDANTKEGMKDILKYRLASLPGLYAKRFESLLAWNLENAKSTDCETLAMDYLECLKKVDNAVIYADPPYAFVHYSRFYHAMETLVRYDYPEIQQVAGKIVKGRYRVERHQSPFCIRTQVKKAFGDLFTGVKTANSDLILSYSNTGMISIDDLTKLASENFGEGYVVTDLVLGHTHMTMGRSKDHSRQVEETLIIAKRKKQMALSRAY